MRYFGTRRYSGYHGRRPGSPNRTALLVLALILLAALLFLFAQRYRVYNSDGSSHYEMPWSKKETVQESGGGQELEIVIENPDGTETTIKGG